LFFRVLPTSFDNEIFDVIAKFDLKIDSESHPNLFGWSSLLTMFNPFTRLGWSDAR
jgi:hypothetical protein